MSGGESLLFEHPAPGFGNGWSDKFEADERLPRFDLGERQHGSPLRGSVEPESRALCPGISPVNPTLVTHSPQASLRTVTSIPRHSLIVIVSPPIPGSPESEQTLPS